MYSTQRKIQIGFGGGLTPVVRGLLLTNLGFFLLHWIMQRIGTPLEPLLALQPTAVIRDFAFWQLATYLFLHHGVFHLIFNMFALWMFGGEVERTLGSSRFLKYYFFTGIGAGLVFLLFNWNSSIPVVGASGAIYGVLVAFAVLFPDRIITLLLFFVFPINMKAKYLALIFVGISLLLSIEGQLFGVTDGVAHLAHLGGAVVGFGLLRGRYLFRSWRLKYYNFQEGRILQKQKIQHEKMENARKEIDRILDKINEVGLDRISPEERAFLKKASEFLSQE